MYCKFCGSESHSDNKFCRKCGKPLASEAGSGDASNRVAQPLGEARQLRAETRTQDSGKRGVVVAACCALAICVVALWGGVPGVQKQGPDSIVSTASMADAGSTAVSEAEENDEDPLRVPDDLEFPTCFYYNKLSGSDQAKYRAIYWAYKQRASVDYPGGNDSEEDCIRIYNYFFADHPEFIDAGHSYGYNVDASQRVCSVYPHFLPFEDDLAERQKAIDKAVKKCKKGIPKGADDFEKAKYVCEYLCDTVTYDTELYDAVADLDDNDPLTDAVSLEEDVLWASAWNALVKGRAVCGSYARAYQLVMQSLGYECVYVIGEILEDGEGHAWNCVKLDGDWYYVDVTWVDDDSRADVNNHDALNWAYFGMTDEIMQGERRLAEWQELLPKSTSSYYAREGKYLEAADYGQVAVWLDEAADGSGSFGFQCANDEVFDSIGRGLEQSAIPSGYQGYYEWIPWEATRVYRVDIG